MIKIMIADDHDLVRDTIAAYLDGTDGFTTLTASTADDALRLMSAQDQIDMLILDYNMPGMNGLDGLDRAKQRHPETKIMLMSGVANREVAAEAMARGADGFLPKSLAAGSLVNAIKFVLSGERYVPFEFSASAPAPQKPALGRFSTLTEREMETLEQLCGGLSNKEIARALGIKEVTVKLHVKNLFAKLGVTNRTQAALMAKEAQVF